MLKQYHRTTKVLFFSLLMLIFGCSKSQDSDHIIAFENVNIVDAALPNGILGNQNVIIQDNRIIAVGNSNETRIPKGAMVINGEGKYLMPGLWDAHVHLVYEPEMTNSMFDLFLVNGVTSIRDTGGELDLVIPLKQQADASPKTTPRVKVAGPLLDGVPTVYDGVSRIKLGVGAATPEDARQLVDKFVDAGVDLIKSYEILTPEAFKAVIDQAKLRGKVVTGHVPLSMDVVDASAYGLRSMEHMRNLEMSISEDHDSLLLVRSEMLKNPENLLGLELRSSIHQAQRLHAVKTESLERRNLVLKALKENNTWQTPTLSIITPRAFKPFSQSAWRDNYKYLPKSVDDRWTKGSIQASDLTTTAQDSIYPNWALEMVNHLKEAQVSIMAGTDAPIFYLTPGFSLHNELSLLVQAGLTPLEAIESATLKPAEYFGLATELGQIKEGFLADLVLLTANPLERISNTKKIDAVMKDGNLMNRVTLDQILEKLDTGSH